MMRVLEHRSHDSLIARCREHAVPQNAFVFGMEKRDIATLLVERLSTVEITREVLSDVLRGLPVLELFGNPVASASGRSAPLVVEKLVWPATVTPLYSR